MDVTSYLLGKNAGGGSAPALQNKSVTITENGTTNVTADSGYDGLSKVEVITNVPTSGPDLSEYFGDTITNGVGETSGVEKLIKKVPDNLIVSGTNLGNAFANCRSFVNAPLLDTSSVVYFDDMFHGCDLLVNVPAYNTSNGTSMRGMFQSCISLETAPSIDTSNCQDITAMFLSCSKLKNVPIYNWSSATTISSVFNGCSKLTDESLDNILQSYITAVSYTGTKNLSSSGLSSGLKSRCSSLPHYQDFVNAGWSIY